MELINKISDHLKKKKTKLAVVFGSEEITYEELRVKVNLLASYLQEKKIRKGKIVTIFLSPSIEFVISVLAVLKTGAAYIPISKETPLERIQKIIKSSESNLIIFNGEQQMFFKKLDCDILNFETLDFSKQHKDVTVQIQENDLAYILFTSGSTGQPKGVKISHKNLSYYSSWTKAFFKTNINNKLPLTSDINFAAAVSQLFMSLSSGETLHIVANCLNNPEKLFMWYSKNPEFGFYCVPSVWSLAIDWFKKNKKTTNPPKALFLSGEDITQNLIKETQKVFPKLPIWNLYGPTEAVANLSYKKILSEKEISIGVPLPKTRFYVIGKNKKEVTSGQRGLLYASGPGISSGYFNDKKLTEKNFFKFESQKDGIVTVYNTGDIVCKVKKNDYLFLGREDQQIKINGQRIEIGEIENTLSNHSLISNCIIIYSDKSIIAYIKPKSSTDLEIESLRSFLLQFLPSVAIPEKWVFVDEFPILANGKINRKKLPEIQFSRPKLKTKHIQASNIEEEKMLGLFEHILNIKGLGIQDNFFNLGGNSLKVVSLLIAIEEVFYQKLNFQIIFNNPTPEKLLKSFSKNQTTTPGTSFSKKEIYGKTSLSVQQKALFFYQQANPNNTSYNIAYSIKLSGSITIDRLTKSIQKIFSSNELLSSKIIIDNKQPFFKYEKKDIALVAETLELLPDSEKENFANNSISNIATIPFKLNSNLFKFKLFKVSSKIYILGFVVNHIIFDGESLPNFIHQLIYFYGDKKSDKTTITIPSFKEITSLRNQYEKTEKYKESLGFWKRYLKEVKEINGFPKLYLNKKNTAFESGTISTNIDADLRKKLKRVSLKENITLNVLLLSAFVTTLNKIGRKEEYLIAVPFSNRLSKAEQECIGYLSNTLFIRSTVNSTKTFSSLAKQLKSDIIQILDHQQIPFDELIKILRKNEVNLTMPAFKLLFTYHQKDKYSLKSSKLDIDAKEVENKNSKCELQFECFDDSDMIELKVTYDKKIIDEPIALQFVRILKQILINIIEDFNSELSVIPKIWKSEKDAILESSIGRNVDFKRELTLFNLFKKAWEKYPNLTAINFYNTDLSYDQLMKKTSLIVTYLEKIKLNKNHPVAIYMDHCPEMIIAKLALAAIAVPYIPLDPVYPKKRNLRIIQDANVDCVLTTSNEAIKFLEENNQIVFIDKVITNNEKVKNIIPKVTKKDLLYLIYTSGSTGKPKGVMVPNKGVANYLLWMKDFFEVDTNSKILAKTSISFDISVWELFLPLISGGTLVLKKRIDLESPEQIASAVEDHKITIIQFVPSGLRLFNNASNLERLTSLENVFCGGEKMPTALQNEVLQNYNGKLHNLYGPTEASIFMAHHTCTENFNHYNVPIGKPIYNSSMYILDDHKNLVPRGIPGDIYIGGKILANGYWKNKLQTKKAFVTYLNDNTPEILYNTGDIGRLLPEGSFEFQGRNDNQIKIRGYRVELGEIEAAIYLYPGILEVVAYKNIINADDERLNALIVANSLINLEDLKKRLSSDLPKYMIPSSVIQVSEVPKLPNGKIDLNAILEVSQKNTKPLTKTEKLIDSNVESSIFKIWTEVIGHENFSLTDNFFDAGGHSVLFIKVKERLEKKFGVNFSIVELYQHPNIKSIADEYRKRYANVISDKAKEIRDRTKLKKQSFGRSRRK
tara:strand:+ start:7658 stop:12628 length:4971 start_codon:yes stop_codon:yes gene_type:complete